MNKNQKTQVSFVNISFRLSYAYVFPHKKDNYPYSVLLLWSLSSPRRVVIMMTDVSVLEDKVVSFLFLLSSKPTEKWGTGNGYMEIKMSALSLIKLISKHGFRSVAR